MIERLVAGFLIGAFLAGEIYNKQILYVVDPMERQRQQIRQLPVAHRED